MPDIKTMDLAEKKLPFFRHYVVQLVGSYPDICMASNDGGFIPLEQMPYVITLPLYSSNLSYLLIFWLLFAIIQKSKEP